MPFIPHTAQDVEEMLQTICVENIQQLFDEIPKDLPKAKLAKIPPPLKELAVTRLLRECEPLSDKMQCFLGAGAYEHHIPAAVWQIASRGEFYTAYTPYQAEASQGSLQLIYEFQTMMAELMAMDVSNASMYDGSTALLESILMAVRIKRGQARRVFIPANSHPHYRQVLNTILSQQQIELVEIPFDKQFGTLDFSFLEKVDIKEVAALVISQPNFFGAIEAVDSLTNWAHENNLLVIAQVNPIAMSLLKPPGEWGEKGVDIACGEGQPLGVPLSSGGPYFGFMCCRQEYVRQLPGRLVGKTVDTEGREGYTLTLQAREQHIRRDKATSNICTNQGLMVVAATIFMSLLGAAGLREMAVASYQNAKTLREKLSHISGVEVVFSGHHFHEFVLKFKNITAENGLKKLAEYHILGGVDLGNFFAGMENCILVCATETKTEQDINRYCEILAKITN